MIVGTPDRRRRCGRRWNLSMSFDTLLEPLVQVAREAGSAILRVYATDFDVRHKADRSPVTDADLHAEQVIVAALSGLTPGVPIVSEEAASDAATPDVGDRFWLVDPLDGTREFVRRSGEFTVNIALIQDGRPVLGLIYAPALQRLYAGSAEGGAYAGIGGERRRIACRRAPPEGLVVVTSRSHQDQAAWSTLLRGKPIASHTTAGSSLKFGLIASGEADAYPRTGRTWEWDTAAGHAIVAAAGGHVTGADRVELRYGKPNFLNPAFVAYGLID
jgi:3'(2'), 5'-bisphosphate nucleotidase